MPKNMGQAFGLFDGGNELNLDSTGLICALIIYKYINYY